MRIGCEKRMLKGLLSLFVALAVILGSVKPVASLVLYEESLPQDETDELQEVKDQKCISGYAYVDNDHSQIMKEDSGKIAGLYIKLWKDHDLLMVTQTDEQGYYQFEGILPTNTYTLTIDQLDHYSIIQEDMTLSIEEGLLFQYNIGFIETKYKLRYDLNGGYGELEKYKELHFYQDIITIIENQSLKKDGYIFGGWNTCKDGTGKTYQANDFFSMPDHSVTLYAMWKRINTQAPSTLHSKYLEDGSQVLTSDKSHVLFLTLLLLSSCGGIIIFKSLKKRKNR